MLQRYVDAAFDGNSDQEYKARWTGGCESVENVSTFAKLEKVECACPCGWQMRRGGQDALHFALEYFPLLSSRGNDYAI
jgi:hypothetical protein